MSDLERLNWVRPVVRQAARMAREGRALDLGAGVGRHALFLAKRGLRVTAVESSLTSVAAMRELARLQALPVRAIRADVTEYAPAGNAYDLVLATMLLHVIGGEKREGVVARMKAATRRGGIVVTSDYSPRNPPGTRPHPVSPEDLRRWFPAPEWEVLSLEHRRTDPVEDLSRAGKTTRFWVVDCIARRLA